jgi:hypothetical protein
MSSSDAADQTFLANLFVSATPLVISESAEKKIHSIELDILAIRTTAFDSNSLSGTQARIKKCA